MQLKHISSIVRQVREKFDINFFLGFFAAVLPLFLLISSIDLNRESKDLLFVIISILLFRKSSGKVHLITLFILVVIIFSPHNKYSIYHSIMIMAGWSLFLSYYSSYKKETVNYVYYGIVAGSLIQSIIAIGGYFGIELYGDLLKLLYNVKTVSERVGSSNVVGSLGNNNLLSSYVCISLPSFFVNKRIKYLVIIPITALLLSHSWMGIASGFAGLFYFLFNKYKTHIYSLSAMTMCILPFTNIGIDSGRFEIWRNNLKSLSFFGHGPGWFPSLEVLMRDGSMILQEHNSYLSLVNTFGILSLLITIPFFIKWITTKDISLIPSTTLFIIFCNSWGHFTLQQSTVVIIIIPIIVICLGDMHDSKRSRI